MMQPGGTEESQSFNKVAVVGPGYWGKNLVRNFSNLQALSVICDSDTATHRALSEPYHGCRMVETYGEVLKDEAIQAVAIATPAETHATLVRQALLAGKDVLVENLCAFLKRKEEHW